MSSLCNLKEHFFFSVIPFCMHPCAALLVFVFGSLSLVSGLWSPVYRLLPLALSLFFHVPYSMFIVQPIGPFSYSRVECNLRLVFCSPLVILLLPFSCLLFVLSFFLYFLFVNSFLFISYQGGERPAKTSRLSSSFLFLLLVLFIFFCLVVSIVFVFLFVFVQLEERLKPVIMK